MGKVTPEKANIQFWLPEADDLARVLKLLEICGYTDRALAIEDSMEGGESNTVYEVTIKRYAVESPRVWQEEAMVNEHPHEGIWQA